MGDHVTQAAERISCEDSAADAINRSAKKNTGLHQIREQISVKVFAWSFTKL